MYLLRLALRLTFDLPDLARRTVFFFLTLLRGTERARVLDFNVELATFLVGSARPVLIVSACAAVPAIIMATPTSSALADRFISISLLSLENSVSSDAALRQKNVTLVQKW